MDKIRIGVIGVGRMGQPHCRVYSSLRQAQLVGVCDTNAEAGRQVAQQYDVPFYHEIDGLLEQVDAVSLVTPTPFHFDLAKRCLERGIHVLIEKPIAETLEQAEILAQMAENSGLIVQVGHIERFNPAYVELKNILKEMTVLAVTMNRLSAYENSNKDVNVVLDLMIHDIDLALNLMGHNPNLVSAQGLTALSNVVDYAAAHMCFEGSLLSMTASRVTEHKIRTINVTALEGYVECDLLNKSILVHRRTNSQFLDHTYTYRQESIVESIHVPTYEPLFLELEHFVTCIMKNGTPDVSARNGLEALKFAMMIQENIDKQLVSVNAAQQLASAKRNGELT